MAKRDQFQINNFDLLRLLAALQVVLFHTVSRFELPLSDSLSTIINAFPGVPIFFVMSGFLISAAYERSPSLSHYAKNRLYRILPALWACIFLSAVTALGLGYDLLNPQGVVWFVAQLGGLIYTPASLADFGFGSYNGALWTIPLELQFYAMLPICYWLFRSSKSTTRLLAYTTVVFFGIALAYQYHVVSISAGAPESTAAKLLRYTFLPHFYLFLIGVCLQRARAEASFIIKGKGCYWLAGYLAMVYLFPDTPLLHIVKLMTLAITCISLAYTLPALSRRLVGKTDISYGLYIYHGLVHAVFFELSLNHGWSDGMLAIAVSILLGWVSWIVLERSFIQRKRPAAQEPATSNLTAQVPNAGSYKAL